MREAPSAPQHLESLTNGLGIAGHFKDNIDAKAFGDIEYFLHRINFTRINHVVCAHFCSDTQAFGIGFNGKDGAGTRDP
jgi:hypothetical protein